MDVNSLKEELTKMRTEAQIVSYDISNKGYRMNSDFFIAHCDYLKLLEKKIKLLNNLVILEYQIKNNIETPKMFFDDNPEDSPKWLDGTVEVDE